MFDRVLNMLLYTKGSFIYDVYKNLKSSDRLSATIQFCSEYPFLWTFLIGLNNPPHSEYDVSEFSSETLTVRSIYSYSGFFSLLKQTTFTNEFKHNKIES